MTFTEVAVVVSGLAIGWWLVSVFLPNARKDDAHDTHDGLPPGAERDVVPDGKPWYEVLEVAPNATREEIDAAYRRAIALYPPERVADLGPELRAIAEAKARQIEAAYAQATRPATIEL